jgi:hypothetical protein
MESITHKWITVDDIGRDLNPIGFGLKSPIRRPSKFGIAVIGRLLTETGVTRMYEVFEQDHSMKVLLTPSNYRQSFQQIWEEQNPGKEFPWAKRVYSVPTTPAPVPAEALVKTEPVAEPVAETVTPIEPVAAAEESVAEKVEDVATAEAVEAETQPADEATTDTTTTEESSEASAEAAATEESTETVAEDVVAEDTTTATSTTTRRRR